MLEVFKTEDKLDVCEQGVVRYQASTRNGNAWDSRCVHCAPLAKIQQGL